MEKKQMFQVSGFQFGLGKLICKKNKKIKHIFTIQVHIFRLGICEEVEEEESNNYRVLDSVGKEGQEHLIPKYIRAHYHRSRGDD